ncbi:tyrosine-protein phosphatase [Christensenella tenuis]|jgi:protein-tyrosine phosphatase|uniref:Tyrosine-protein phosphatase n=1 Tax=Christensenella tenuis TaxID=2763033 RepID=A0ABR7EEV9_9FIRM|nr:tyrosine-protein phosphatase [Christensenella tenuis]MBC5648286.1 tyrosine-protein phosphatase [Christensenella tenuis]
MNVSKPLPLTGAHNVRDLGGYPTEDGKRTKYKAFLRGDSLNGLTGKDRAFLAEYGVTLVIDLRSSKETKMNPDHIDKREMEYLNVPLLDQIQSTLLKGKMPDDMSEMYIGLVENSKDGLKEVFTRMVNERGVILYHCTAGKDRTGIITMLLLKLAGVADDTVLADYAISETYMKETFERQRKMVEAAGIKAPDYVFRSKPEYMQKLMEHIAGKYGTAKGYLESLGLSEEEIGTLEGKIV